MQQLVRLGKRPFFGKILLAKPENQSLSLQIDFNVSRMSKKILKQIQRTSATKNFVNNLIYDLVCLTLCKSKLEKLKSFASVQFSLSNKHNI